MIAPPPLDATARQRRSQKRVIQIAIAVLVTGAIAIALLASTIPLVARLLLAGFDLALAAVLGVVLRQKFRD